MIAKTVQCSIFQELVGSCDCPSLWRVLNTIDTHTHGFMVGGVHPSLGDLFTSMVSHVDSNIHNGGH